MVTAAALPEQVKGVSLLNSAGQFGDAITEKGESEETPLQTYVLKPVKEVFQRIVLGLLFWQAKQPSRIKSVLSSVSQILTPGNEFVMSPLQHICWSKNWQESCSANVTENNTYVALTS